MHLQAPGGLAGGRIMEHGSFMNMVDGVLLAWESLGHMFLIIQQASPGIFPWQFQISKSSKRGQISTIESHFCFVLHLVCSCILAKASHRPSPESRSRKIKECFFMGGVTKSIPKVQQWEELCPFLQSTMERHQIRRPELFPNPQ